MENDIEASYKLLCTACLCFGRTVQPLRDEKLNQCYLDIIKEIPLYNTPIQCPSVCLECSAQLRKLISFREQVQDSYRILQAYTNETLTEFLLTDVSRPPRLRVHILEPVNILPASITAGVDKHVLKHELKDELCGEDIEVQIDKVKARSEFVKDSEIAADSSYFVCVKNELKDENQDDESAPDNGLSDCPLSDHEDPSQLDQLQCNVEKELQSFLAEMEKEKKAKVKKKKNRKKNEQNDKTSTAPNKETSKILTIELTYEQMLSEREREATRESYTKAEFKCESCLMGFNYRASYNSHMTAKHSPSIGTYSCLVCKTLFSTIESLQVHYKRHMRRFQCGICQKRTLDMKVMEQHYYSSHNISLKQYECPICPHVSNSIDLHRYHKDSHKARLQCPECDKRFVHRAGLHNHRLAVHRLRNSFPCDVCHKVFRWKTSLKRHLEKHDATDKLESNRSRCDTCEISFASECSYKRHLKSSLRHVTQDQLRYVCDDCNKRFADKTKLRDHIEEKHLHKTYQCRFCLKPSKNRVGLDQHIRNVHKRRPNDKMCHHCGKGFPTRVQLESHMRTHTGERPFICEFCPTMFSQQSNLYKHNRQVHLNMKSKRYPLNKKRKDEQPQEDYQAVKRKDQPELPAMTMFAHYAVNDRFCPVSNTLV